MFVVAFFMYLTANSIDSTDNHFFILCILQMAIYQSFKFVISKESTNFALDFGRVLYFSRLPQF